MTGKQLEWIAFLPKFSKHSKKYCHNLLLNCFTWFFPQELFQKSVIAKVFPLHKKDNNLECNNYRPISLLSSIGKIIEKLLHKRLYSLLEHNKFIYNLQFGFRPIHSVNHELISITEQVKTSLDKNKFACVVFLDFQKAFDTVNHKILLSKLSHHGIGGIPHKLSYS